MQRSTTAVLLVTFVNTLLPTLILAQDETPIQFGDQQNFTFFFASTVETGTTTATGPEVGTRLEDRVEISWGVEADVAQTSLFQIERDTEILALAAPEARLFDDVTAEPGVTYNYCVREIKADESEILIACDDGGREINRPTGFTASDGSFETQVALRWTDRSNVESGFILFRDAGNALDFDGTNDYVEVSGDFDLTQGFTFEFWASRGSTGSDDYVLNVEALPATTEDRLEIGFTSSNKFQVAFGTDRLESTDTFIDSDWHHFAVTYNPLSRRRSIYVDGARIATDVVVDPYEQVGDLEFGRRRRTGNNNKKDFFDGTIDEVRFWSIARPPEAIARDANGLLSASTPGFASYWPMDVSAGTTVPDVVGAASGLLLNSNNSAWVTTGVSDFRTEVSTDVTIYSDQTAAPGFQFYNYRLAAFQDTDNDGSFTAGVDLESEERSDDGWRGIVTPPAAVAATDGQFLDRVRVTWIDQSANEDSYNIYRGGALIGSAQVDSMRFDDLSPLAGTNEYCVAAVAGGVASIQECDDGRAGGLVPPEMVEASNGTFDDRIMVTWEDPSTTESGFEIFRNDILVGTTPVDVAQFRDETAPAVIGLQYCVRAFSDADPENISYSDTTCASGLGLRAISLPPTDVSATDGDHEDRVNIAWTNPSKTALLFKVYREGALIGVLPAGETQSSDTGIASDTPLEYCVSTIAVSDAAAAKSLQDRIAHVIRTARNDETVGAALGRQPVSVADLMGQIEAAIPQNSLSKNGAAVDTVFESSLICDDGSRSIAAPTNVAATDDDFENHVQVTWTTNSAIATGYEISRVNGGTPTVIDTVSANRTSFGDFEGTPGVVYDYVVTALDEFDASVSDDDLGLRELEPVTQLVAGDGTSETVVFIEWSDNSAAEEGFRIYRKEADEADTEYASVGTTDTNESAFPDTVSGTLRGVDFTYKVVAFDNFGESEGLADDGRTMIQAPTNLNASNVYLDSVTVVWTDVSVVEEGYRMTVRELQSNTPSIDQDLATNSTFFSHVGVSGTVYEYCITAFLTINSVKIYSDEVCDEGNRFVPEGGAVATAAPTKITKSDPPGGEFGFSIDISGTKVLVGWPDGISTDAGKALPFTVDLATNVFTEGTALDLGFAAEVERIGHDVAVSGNFSAATSPRAGDDDGGWFIYENTVLTNWSIPDEVDDQPEYGSSVALADSLFIIGGPGYSDSGSFNDGGRAFICDVQDSDCNLNGDIFDGIEGVLRVMEGRFGESVDIAKGTSKYYAIIGQPGADLAYIFSCTAATGCDDIDDWSLDRRLDSPQGLGIGFGTSVAISSSFALVGTPGEQRVQVYRRSGSTWSEVEIFFPSVSSDLFGQSVDVFGNNALVGAPEETVSGVDNAGAVYAYEWDPDEQSWSEAIRYDANVSGSTSADALFGHDVAVGEGVYLAGAPGVNSFYSIPFFFEPIDPTVDDLSPPEAVAASDGTPDDRIRLRWSDESDGEDGYYIYRSDDKGSIELFAEVDPNIEFYDDFEAMPGAAYKYCVAAYLGNTETNQKCDIGWIPPNGTIAGRVATLEGAGTSDAKVCLVPSPNRALIFDGVQGFVSVPDSPALDLENDYTIEAWIRPEATDGTRYIVSKDGAFALLLNGGNLRLRAGTDYDKTLSSPIPAGEWHHVAVAFDDNNDAQFYVDGQPAGGVVTGALPSELNSNSLSIGQKGGDTGYFEGQIDEVRVWNITRSTSEILESWQMRMTGLEEGLAGYWPLDQGMRLIAPDISESANHATISGAAYVSDDGAPLDVCAASDLEGNYTLSGIRYGESTKFQVIPFRSDRDFDPDFKTITLSPDSPVQNEVDFVDATAYTVAGLIEYKTVSQSGNPLSCPVPDVAMHLGKESIATDANIKTTTAADGSFALAVDPSVDQNDPWFIIPTFSDPEDGSVIHTFSPDVEERAVLGPIFDLNIENTLRHTLSGNYTGGDPGLCGKDIGIADIRIYTADGCFDDTLRVSSADLKGIYSLDLPPLNYLVEIVSIDSAPAVRSDDIKAFFEGLGTLELDMTKGDVGLDFLYRAPLVLNIEGLEPPPQCTSFSQFDEDNTLIRTLDPVAIIDESDLVPLRITVQEDYGDSQFCNVDEGTVSIFDGIGDRVDVDSVMSIRNGEVLYETFGASANPFGGARVEGVDRSFQKPISVIARVEGRDPLLKVDWAMVKGMRERASTFVSATTSEFPLLIVHDPPGDGSSAFLTEGTSMCSSFESMKATGGSAGVDIDVAIGFKSGVGFGVVVDAGGGLVLKTRTLAGQTTGSLWDAGGDNFEVCVSTTDTWSTSDDEKYIMDDVYVGVALNLIFALADVLDFDDLACRVDLSEILATDLNNADPFATTYTYSESHIRGTLMPMLEQLIDLAGDADLQGTIDDEETTVSLEGALANWQAQLDNNQDLKDDALGSVEENRSFDGGGEISFESTYDSTYVTDFENIRIFFDSDNYVGGVITAGYDQNFGVAFEIHSEWVTEEKETETESSALGYTLADDDPGDFFSVDISTDSRYGTPVFGLKSGRSSNPWEVGTQPRDRAILNIDPPVREAVSSGGPAVFTLTMTNASESVETREYVLRSILTSNPGGAKMTAQGTTGLHAGLSFFLDGDPSNASQEVSLAVEPGPVNLDYEDLQIQMYPAGEYPIWEDGGVGNSGVILQADTVTFDVFFSSLGTPAPTTFLTPGWNPFSISTEGGTLGDVLETVNLSHGDMIVSDHGEAKYDSANGWSGSLSHVIPGYGYKLFVRRPSVLVQRGDPLNGQTPVELANGWNLIGYLPPQSMPIAQALASIEDEIAPGDILVGTSSFAQFVDGKGWVGSLTELEPGQAYGFMIKSGGSLVYPASEQVPAVAKSVAPSVETTRRFDNSDSELSSMSEQDGNSGGKRISLKEQESKSERAIYSNNSAEAVPIEAEAEIMRAEGPDWRAPSEKYAASMTLVIELQKDGVTLVDPETELAFFANDTLRGVGSVEYVEALGRDLVFAVVYGDDEKAENLTIRVYNASTQQFHNDVGIIRYSANAVVGTPVAPRVVEVTDYVDLAMAEELPTEFALDQNYPNPFNPTTTITYALPQAGHVELKLFDVLGRSIMTLVNEQKEAGRYEINFDGRGLASGAYFYEIKAENFSLVRKMTLAK
ncbi:MAG: LamG-like jellyroll fold domain-containing protein [Rhodothermia bacterium]